MKNPKRNRSSSPIDIARLSRKAWWDDVDVGEGDKCWAWKKSTGSHGYGQTWDGVAVRLAHRVAWTLHHGVQIPEGLTIDHICRVRRCCNPAHMRLLTNVENARDNGNLRKTHCPQGHPYDEPNTYVDPDGARRCRLCGVRQNKRWRAARAGISELFEREVERGEMLADDYGTPLDNEGDLKPARWLNRPEVRDA